MELLRKRSVLKIAVNFKLNPKHSIKYEKMFYKLKYKKLKQVRNNINFHENPKIFINNKFTNE